MRKTWLITGSSSGFGRILAEMVLRTGDNVVVSARRPADLADIVAAFPEAALSVPLDVTHPDQAAAAVELAEARFGGLDVLVNNAGFGLIGAVEECEPAEYRPVFETNLFGLIETTRAALPALRRRGGGRIVNFSSVGGFTGRQGFGLYNASKFAVEGLSEALAEEVAPFGIKVIIVEPGAFRTDFLGRSLAQAHRRLDAYEATSGKTREFSTANNGYQPGDPNGAMQVLIDAVNAPEPPLRLPLGRDAIGRIEAKIDRFMSELDGWREKSLSTAFDPPEKAP